MVVLILHMAFGYDSINDFYKVVAIFFYICDNGVVESQVKVHTLGTNSWRMVQGDFPVPMGSSLKFVSGTLKWISCNDDYNEVVSFDLANESYRKFLQPNYEGFVDRGNVILGVLKDCLCILTPSYALSYVWLMKEYGNEVSWTKLFSVPDVNDLFFF